MRESFGAVNNLFTMILVGLAGNSASTQSSTIRSLIFCIKQNVILNKNNQINKVKDEELDGENDSDDDNTFADAKEQIS